MKTPLSPDTPRDAMAEPLVRPDQVLHLAKLWVALAEAERELGLNITEGQIAEP